MKPVPNPDPRLVVPGDWVRLPGWGEYYEVMLATRKDFIFKVAPELRYLQDRKDGMRWEFRP